MSKHIGKILKIVLIVAIIAVIALLAVNMARSSHKELEDVIASPSFKEAYAVSTDLRTHPLVDDGFSPNGGVYAYSLVYIEQAGYIQLTVRYNNRHMDDVAKNYPDFDKSLIRYTLTDANGVVYTPAVLESASKYHYEYFKLEFTGVDFSTTSLTLNMIIDALSEVIGEKNSLVIHTQGEQYLPYALNSDESAQLQK